MKTKLDHNCKSTVSDLKFSITTQMVCLVMAETVTKYQNIPEVRGISSERDLKLFQKFVHSGQQGLRSTGFCVYTRSSFKNNHPVGQVGRHDEIVLDYKTSLFRVQNETFDHLKMMKNKINK